MLSVRTLVCSLVQQEETGAGIPDRSGLKEVDVKRSVLERPFPCVVRSFRCMAHPMRDLSVVRSSDRKVCEKGIPLETFAGFFNQSRKLLTLVGSERGLSSLFLFGL